jgi:aspartate/methionine/tyrosine aminotransferase
MFFRDSDSQISTGEAVKPLASRTTVLSGEGALSVFKRARQLEDAGRNIIHLELGEPDFHPDATVLDAAKTALDLGQDRYSPPPGLPLLQEELVRYLARTREVNAAPDNIVIAPGCKMILSLAMMALIEPGDEVLYPEPSFPIYPSQIRMLGGTPVAFTLAESNAFQPDPDEIRAKVTSRTKAIILNSPNNPTGTVVSDEVMRAIAEITVHRDLWMVSDEIYARIVYGRCYRSIYNLPGMAERTLIIDGFSKTFAMTGWRLGYVVAPPDVVAALHLLVVNTYTCASEFIQRAAVAALRDEHGVAEKMIAEFASRRERFVAEVNQIPGFRCALPDGAFYAWVHVEQTEMAAEAVADLLLEQAGVAGIPGRAFGLSGANFLRFSFAASQAQLHEAVERMRAASEAWAPQGATRTSA